MSGAFETADRPCDYPGCKEKGAYRAPKSPDLLDEYFWFCKDHIREYNLKWNFFQGTTDDEFQKFLDRCIDVVTTKLLPKVTSEELRAELESICGVQSSAA